VANAGSMKSSARARPAAGAGLSPWKRLDTLVANYIEHRLQRSRDQFLIVEQSPAVLTYEKKSLAGAFCTTGIAPAEAALNRRWRHLS
jgi:hypothetical protein